MERVSARKDWRAKPFKIVFKGLSWFFDLKFTEKSGLADQPFARRVVVPVKGLS
jgi:hypothetical protein